MLMETGLETGSGKDMNFVITFCTHSNCTGCVDKCYTVRGLSAGLPGGGRCWRFMSSRWKDGREFVPQILRVIDDVGGVRVDGLHCG